MIDTGTTYHNPEADETVVLVSAGDRNVFAIDAYNGAGAADAYVQMFDAAKVADVALGTTVPRWVLPVPAGGGHAPIYTQPLPFDAGLVVAVTSTPDGNGAPNAPIVLSIRHGRD